MTQDADRERVGVIFVHGVGNCEPGWINPYIIERLEARCKRLETQPYWEASRLADRGRRNPGSYFPGFVRRANMGPGRTIAFLELHWADLSKIGAGPFYHLLASLRLFYEAPLILAHSFMQQSRTGYYLVLKQIILAATWLLRWPIAGMNTSAIACCLAIIGLDNAELLHVAPLPLVLCVLLGLLAVSGFFIAWRRIHRDLWLTDVALATSLFSVLAIACIVGLNFLMPYGALAVPDAYLALVLPPILYIWVVWSVMIAVAILMILPVYLKRMLGWRPAASFPIARPAAAIGLVLLQGLLWKVVVAPFSISVIQRIGAIKAASPAADVWALSLFGSDLDRCKEPVSAALAIVCGLVSSAPAWVLADAVARLKGVFVFNSLHALYTAALFVIIIMVRVLIARATTLTLEAKFRLMPRVIFSQALILFLFAGSLFNLYIYGWQLYETQFFLNNLPGIRSVWLWPTLLLMIIAVAYFFNVFQVVTASIVHIARDIVDHQYRPRFHSFEFAMRDAVKTKSRWPRRARIQERMNELIQTVVRANAFDRLVLVGHSQGSVIIYEYLKSKDDDADLSAMDRVDVVTVGSPLTHLYQYYFDEYGSARPTAEQLLPKLKTWTNLYRIDDPIGGHVDIVAGGFVRNVAMGRGGHVDYWRDPEVCDAILDAIAPDWATSGAAADSVVLSDKVILFADYAAAKKAASLDSETATA